MYTVYKKTSVLYSGYMYYMGVAVAMVCMMCTLSCYEGPGDMLPWINKT